MILHSKDAPWRAVIPMLRPRRDVMLPTEAPSVFHQVKFYSRIVACTTLVLAALVEIVVYVVEVYGTMET